MRLPDKFERDMRELLGEEAEDFFASYGLPRTSGLRLNGLKLGREAYEERFGTAGDAVPWTTDGVYTEEEDRPGLHLHYYLGLYYIQEPSAMLPAELLGVEPGQLVLDLCAAPGGKSTQLAAKLRGRGALVTNDNSAERTKALAKNVERSGGAGVVVTNEEPGRLAEAFGAIFDRVLVDAPCSGEGMFRKDESMIREWERHSVERCSAMQRDIMPEAARLVAPGGKLLYSTCTFSPRENEGSIARFLAAHPDFEVERVETPAEWGFGPGRPDWLLPEEREGLSEERIASLAGAVRVWPHRSRGEGHFAALLVRKAAGSEPEREAGEGVAARGEGEGERGAAARRASEGAAARGVSEGVAARGVSEGAATRGPAAGEGAAAQEEGAADGGAPWRFPALAASAAGAAPAAATPRGGRLAAQPPKERRGGPRAGKARPDQAAEPGPAEMREMLLTFAQQHLPAWRPRGRLIARGAQLYLYPEALPEPSARGGKLNLVRPGLLLGSATKHRFEPSQALAMALRAEDAARTLRLFSGEEAAMKYIKGETLHPEPGRVVGPDGSASDAGTGWTLVCIDGFPAGWGRYDGVMLKNELLPGWRRM